jgi:hypothetical protein
MSPSYAAFMGPLPVAPHRASILPIDPVAPETPAVKVLRHEKDLRHQKDLRQDVMGEITRNCPIMGFMRFTTSVVDLKFLLSSRRASWRNFKSKTTLES